MILRQGRHRGRVIYAQYGPNPSDDDPFVSMCETAEIAEIFCRAINDKNLAGWIARSLPEHARTKAALGILNLPKGEKLSEGAYGQDLAQRLQGRDDDPRETHRESQ